jgi:hypothetical protein
MNVKMQYIVSFTAGVFDGEHMEMNNYSLKLYMTTTSNDTQAHNIAFSRMKHFILNEIDSSIIISNDETEQIFAYLNAGLDVTTLPSAPVDQIVGIMLYYKLNAIAEKHLTITGIEINSMLGSGVTYTHNDDEVVTDLDIPSWWLTPDLVHCDDLLDDDILVDIKSIGSDIWHELELEWPNEKDKKNTDDISNKVVYADFGRNANE